MRPKSRERPCSGRYVDSVVWCNTVMKATLCCCQLHGKAHTPLLLSCRRQSRCKSPRLVRNMFLTINVYCFISIETDLQQVSDVFVTDFSVTCCWQVADLLKPDFKQVLRKIGSNGIWTCVNQGSHSFYWQKNLGLSKVGHEKFSRT